MGWILGKHNSGYLEMLLAKGKSWSVYLLKYPINSYIPDHIDLLTEGEELHRINFVLKRAKRGGVFYYGDVNDSAKFTKTRFTRFRPDLDRHGVTEVEKGSRYVLSIGWKQPHI